MTVFLDILVKMFISLTCTAIVSFVSGNYVLAYSVALIAFGIACIRILSGVACDLYVAITKMRLA